MPVKAVLPVSLKVLRPGISDLRLFSIIDRKPVNWLKIIALEPLVFLKSLSFCKRIDLFAPASDVSLEFGSNPRSQQLCLSLVRGKHMGWRLLTAS